jgi:predicted DNA-binding protein (MmcQ/YjbR family)
MLNLESIRDFALSLPDVEESLPFGPDVLVYKTAGRMFLLLPLDTEDLRFNVKCEPERAIDLREHYPEAVLPGYHMNKTHWNTVVAGKGMRDAEVLEQIRHSHALISAMPKPRPRSKKAG